MPATPLHYLAAFGLYKLDKKLALPGLAVGSMFPDFEIPVIILFFGGQDIDRLVLHSLLGGATIGTVLSLVFTVFVYPSLTSAVFRINKQEVKRKCRLSSALILSCCLGNISHVLLDIVNHDYNPIFWPFSPPIPSSICAALGSQENASLIVQVLLLVPFAILIISQRRNLWEKLLVGE